MEKSEFTKPHNIIFLVLPYGISAGYVQIAMPYLLTNKGFSVEVAAGIIALGFSANVWRFVFGPIADLTLSLRKWYIIGTISCVISLFILCIYPFNLNHKFLLTALVFISQIAATFVVLPVGGFMASRIKDEEKGKASGWYQAGNLGGVGLGGSLGLWIGNRYGNTMAGLILCILCLASGLIVFFIEDVKRIKNNSILNELKGLGKELIGMVKIPIVLFVMVLICFPIGSGGIANIWSGVAKEWHATESDLILYSAILSGFVGAFGAVVGGIFANKFGHWWAYLGLGTICALVTWAISFMAFKPLSFNIAVLVYSFVLGLINAAFSAIVLFAIGKKSASTKYALLSSLGNVPVVYITAIDGWVHDKYGSKNMLIFEAFIGLIFVAISLIILKWLAHKKLILKSVD